MGNLPGSKTVVSGCTTTVHVAMATMGKITIVLSFVWLPAALAQDGGDKGESPPVPFNLPPLHDEVEKNEGTYKD